MRVLLEIGYEDYLLPDETGLQQVLKILAKAQRVRSHLHRGEIELLRADMARVTVSATIVPGDTRYVQHPPDDGAPVDSHVIDLPDIARSIAPAQRPSLKAAGSPHAAAPGGTMTPDELMEQVDDHVCAYVMALVDEHFPDRDKPERNMAAAKAGQALVVAGVSFLGNALLIDDPDPPMQLAERLFDDMIATARRRLDLKPDA